MAQVGTVSIPIDELRVGATCSHPVESESGVLLLGAMSRITQQVIAGLRERGIDSIEVHPNDLDMLRESGEISDGARAKRERSQGCDGEWVASQPVKKMLVDRHDEDLSDERTQRLKRGMSAAKAKFDQLQSMMANDQLHSVEDLTSVSDAYARAMVDDIDQTVGVMGASTTVSDLAERSVRMSVIGMAVGIEMGLDGPQILEVGMAGLLHDVGVFTMDPKFAKSTSQLTDSEHWEFQKHPFLSVKCVQEIMEVPNCVQLAISQVHEQFDGSGYPRGLKSQRIHVYARILNVVDTYLQLTSATCDRPAIIPHDAMGLILHQASRGIFDPQVIRAFLNTETLFPLGSMVELDNGQLAQVIRRPKSGFSAPVLKSDDGERIDLESSNITIARPVCDAHIEQMRLSTDMMEDARWCASHKIFVV